MVVSFSVSIPVGFIKRARWATLCFTLIHFVISHIHTWKLPNKTTAKCSTWQWLGFRLDALQWVKKTGSVLFALWSASLLWFYTFSLWLHQVWTEGCQWRAGVALLPARPSRRGSPTACPSAGPTAPSRIAPACRETCWRDRWWFLKLYPENGWKLPFPATPLETALLCCLSVLACCCPAVSVSTRKHFGCKPKPISF